MADRMIIDGYCTLGVEREYDLTADSLLSAMDKLGIDRAVIAPVDRQMAVHNREGNDFILSSWKSHRDRFIPTVTVNPWYGETATEELRRAVGEGSSILVLHPTLQGFSPNDEIAYPLYERASDGGMPVYIHTGGYQFGTPCQVSLAAERFPDTAFILGHCGTTDFKVDAREVIQSFADIYGEVSFVKPMGVVSFMNALGRGRLLMGSAAPLCDLSFEWEETSRLFPILEHAAFYGGTLWSLLERRDA